MPAQTSKKRMHQKTSLQDRSWMMPSLSLSSKGSPGRDRRVDWCYLDIWGPARGTRILCSIRPGFPFNLNNYIESLNMWNSNILFIYSYYIECQPTVRS